MIENNPHLGSTLDDLLHEEGVYDDATDCAFKRIDAWQNEQAVSKHSQPVALQSPAAPATPAAH
jgi:hypothetical protein